MVVLHVLCRCSRQHLKQESPWWGGWLLRPHTIALGAALSAPSVRGANCHSPSTACQAPNTHITSSLLHASQGHSHFICEEMEALISLTIPDSTG